MDPVGAKGGILPVRSHKRERVKSHDPSKLEKEKERNEESFERNPCKALPSRISMGIEHVWRS
jgi:hypothetical protein